MAARPDGEAADAVSEVEVAGELRLSLTGVQQQLRVSQCRYRRITILPWQDKL